ncbi:hypothetical protein KSS87_005028 [Heliosperma pusillum]|nr:hypothetical protein KSS87_005028 [Heliosperma pusillum]
MANLRTSLSQSFRKVPPSAVPALLDCILSSTGENPSSLFDSLLSDFFDVAREICDDNKKLSSEECAYVVSYMRGISHLLKKIGVNAEAFERLMREAFIPLVKMTQLYEKEMLHEIVQSLLEIICETNSWDVMEQSLVPFLLRSVVLSMDVNGCEHSFVIRRSSEYVFLGIRELQTSGTVSESIPLLTLTLSCYILSSLLEAATEKCQSVKGYSTSTNVLCPEKFGGHLVWNLCNLTIQMLSQSSEHRSCTAGLLLPSILKAFTFKCTFEVCVQGKRSNISRQYFFLSLWKSARMLFDLGSAERRDAYGIISLYLSYFSCVSGLQVDMGDRAEVFDIKAEKDFWDEMKRGLVEKEGFTRKQSLHILKKVIFSNGGELNSNLAEKKPHQKGTLPRGMTKRDLWAEEEAQSLGVRNIGLSSDNNLSQKQKWEAFILLYDMLEEYGTHLVEAAWNHQISLLLQPSGYHESSMASNQQLDVLNSDVNWLAILWERGLSHDNPIVRCYIMKSFLDINWKSQDNCRKMFPEDFILGAFIQGLNDPVHHKDFGLRGVHCSRTIEGASKFLHHYCSFLSRREQVSFLKKLASVAKEQSLSRAGLMSLSQCVVSASKSTNVSATQTHIEGIFGAREHTAVSAHSAGVNGFPCTDKAGLIDSLRFLVENSKQHFNHKFRFRVCEDVVEAAISVVCAHELPLESIFHFIGALPREFTDKTGFLRIKLQNWLAGNHNQDSAANSFAGMHILHSLCDFPRRFTSCSSGEGLFDDDDLVAWFAEAERWARVLFLVVEEEQQLESLIKFIEVKAVKICQQSGVEECMPVKFLLLLLSLIHELELMQQRVDSLSEVEPKFGSNVELYETINKSHAILEKFIDSFLIIMENLISFAEVSCSIWWADVAFDNELPGSVTGKLGGPSQRRLSSPMTTSVLQAVHFFAFISYIVSVRTLAAVSSWCALQRVAVTLDLAFTYLWNFFHKVVSSPFGDTESSAEIRLAAYEALSFVLKATGRVISSSALSLIRDMHKCPDSLVKNELILDSLALTFINQINGFLAARQLVRSRKAVLLNWKMERHTTASFPPPTLPSFRSDIPPPSSFPPIVVYKPCINVPSLFTPSMFQWLCLEAILSIPQHALQNGVQLGHDDAFFSDDAVRFIFTDLVESLENAGEVSVLPMLRSVRMVLDLLTSGSSYVSRCHGVDVQMIWQLVRSSWILHTSCNKRRVAPIAALLSSVLHVSIFRDEDMHVVHNAPGPLKWFCEKILEEGAKSPRTIRLTALHLTGLWLSNPGVIKYYMKELKLLTLYGSGESAILEIFLHYLLSDYGCGTVQFFGISLCPVAFDEDFEAELLENGEAKFEVSLLAMLSDNEMTAAFINTELYARVSIAVLFNKLADLADLVGSGKQSDDCCAALESGKAFLLELLDSTVNDKDLSKELYKKHSAIHRRKVRAWQMICVLSRFVRQDIIQRVMDCLSTCLYRNNFPAVRQYLETFAIRVYLDFPSLVQKHLVPILCDYDMKTQALSSYVFIAANIMLHAKAEVQSRHLDELLPPIIPLLTSHHHTLRGFTQLLVYQVLCKLLPTSSVSINLEKNCLCNLKTYLSQNPDCVRLRASMEGYLDDFCPDKSVTPAGIFSNRVEDIEFECVPMSLMEQVVNFLNGVREELRSSMAKDDVTLKNESLMTIEDLKSIPTDSGHDILPPFPSSEFSLDFQKKFTLSKHDMLHDEIEKEDQLLEQILHSRNISMEKMKANRQQIILVFKASGLTVADASVLQDKQFQLISVTAEKWVPIIEVPVDSVKNFLEKKKREGFSILGLEQTANSILLDKYSYPQKTVKCLQLSVYGFVSATVKRNVISYLIPLFLKVLVLGREKEGIPADIIHVLDACIEIPQLGVVRSLNVHVSGAIAIWEYTRQQRSK